MGEFRLKMPDVGEGVVEAEIVEWHVRVGDRVGEDDPLVDVMTDKATVEIPAPVAGAIVRLTGAPGDVIAVGTDIVVIGEDAAAGGAGAGNPVSNGTAKDLTDIPANADSAKDRAEDTVQDVVDGGVSGAGNPRGAPAAPPPPPPMTSGASGLSGASSGASFGRASPFVPVSQDTPGVAAAAATTPDEASPNRTGRHDVGGHDRASGRALAAPAVRQRARAAGIDLTQIDGTGPGGRVVHADLDATFGVPRTNRNPGPASGGPTAPVAQDRPSLSAPSSSGQALTGQALTGHARTGQRDTRIIGLRRKIAQNMQKAWDIPHITYAEELDVTQVEGLRQHLNGTRRDGQPKLTVLPFLITALVKAVADVPQANAHYDADAGVLTEFDGVHVGVATATDSGLMVPVLRHVEALDVWGMAAGIAALAQACRDGTAAREALCGSTITVTSLGAMGGIVTTPILNAPETAIIGVNKITTRPAFDENGQVVARKFMTLSSSFDHRIVDGYDAARLIQRVKALVEHPATIFM